MTPGPGLGRGRAQGGLGTVTALGSARGGPLEAQSSRCGGLGVSGPGGERGIPLLSSLCSKAAAPGGRGLCRAGAEWGPLYSVALEVQGRWWGDRPASRGPSQAAQGQPRDPHVPKMQQVVGVHADTYAGS